MIALTCECQSYKRNGKNRKGQQRYKCKSCGRRWTEDRIKPIGDMRIGDMRIDLSSAVLVLKCLLEGMSIRATERLTNTNRETIINLLVLVGGRWAY